MSGLRFPILVTIVILLLLLLGVATCRPSSSIAGRGANRSACCEYYVQPSAV